MHPVKHFQVLGVNQVLICHWHLLLTLDLFHCLLRGCDLVSPNAGIETLVVALHWLAKFKDGLLLVSRCGLLVIKQLLWKLLLLLMTHRVFRNYLIFASCYHFCFILFTIGCQHSWFLLLTFIADIVRDGLLRHWTICREWWHTCSFIGKVAKNGVREWHIVVCLALLCLSLNWITSTTATKAICCI